MDSTSPPAVGTAEPNAEAPPRRNFLVEAAAVICGGIVALVPFAAGAFFFFDPLRRKRRALASAAPQPEGVPEGFIKVASLESVPKDGKPVMFPVISDRFDAWNTFLQEPIGAVFLRRDDQGEVVAFNVTCPHLGCAVDYKPAGNHFHCPCHDSSFTVAGERQNATPPRGMDTLEVLAAKLKDNEVWVKYQNFRIGEPHKIPKA